MSICNSIPIFFKTARGDSVTPFDYRSERIYVRRRDGTVLTGSPNEFVAATGESGDNLLSALLKPPRVSDLLHGAVREALAEVYSLAMIGRQDTRAWDAPDQYIVDDNEGNGAIVKFLSEGCVAAIACHDPTRLFDVGSVASSVPPNIANALAATTALPFFSGANSQITAVFWTRGDVIESLEPWYLTYRYGGEIFRRELLEDEYWESEAEEHYDLDVRTAKTIVELAHKRGHIQDVVRLTETDMDSIVPPAAPYREEALAELMTSGTFAPA